MAMENISETLFGDSESKDNSAGKEEVRGGREASMTTQSTATNNYREAVRREAAATPAEAPPSDNYESQINLERISVRFTAQQRSA